MQETLVVLAWSEKVFAGHSSQLLEPKYVPARHWQLGRTGVVAHHRTEKPASVTLASV